MDEFVHSGEISLRKLGEEHFHWLREVWIRRTENDQGIRENALNRGESNKVKSEKQNLHRNRNDRDRTLYVIFRTKASNRKMHIRLSNHDYKVKHIKRLIWRSMQLANRYRYFFQCWCPEINQMVLDEGCSDSQVVSTCNKNVIVYVEDNY